MAKDKKSKFVDQLLSQHDEWLSGTGHKFKQGQVVKQKNKENLGVVLFPLTDTETYLVKWHLGPKPWNYIEASTRGSHMEVTDKPSPLKYKWSDRVPGPSSTEIDRLEAKFEEARLKKARNLTAKEVEINLISLEEELINKKKLIIEDAKHEVIVDETLEEELPIEEDQVVKKLKDIMEEE